MGGWGGVGWQPEGVGGELVGGVGRGRLCLRDVGGGGDNRRPPGWVG